MFEVSTNTAVMLYLGMTFGVVLGIWIYHHYESRKQKLSLDELELLVCEYCHFAYLGNLGKDVTQCPQCNSFNKSNKYRKK
jgi:hypothetical protein